MNSLKITMTKKQETMKKHLFKTRLLSFAALCGIALTFASCAKEDVAQNTTGTESDKGKNLTTFVAGDEAKTRTSLDYNSSDFYWEAGDYIYVKDDDGVLQKSSNAPTSKVASFMYKVPGKFTASSSYKVYYFGKNSSNNQVVIPAAQTQSTPNSTEHFGVSGDYGTATATGTLGGKSFSFQLEHQAAYLVFQPYLGNDNKLVSTYVTKIEVFSDNDITGTYTLNSSTGDLTGIGTGKQIVLTTQSVSGTYSDGFPLTNATPNVALNGAYMIIQPGVHALTVKYTFKDVKSEVEGTITKVLGSFNYAKNTYYDMTCNLNITNYPSQQYYMWDAVNHFWYGYESQQPKVMGFGSGMDFPKSATDSQNRWYNPASFPIAASNSCVDCPNANELCWYVKKGDPHWDNGTLWTMGGHLFNQGVWIKKQSIIASDNATTKLAMRTAASDGVDYTASSASGVTQYESYSVQKTKPTNINNYFYLPAFGKCLQQTNWTLGYGCYYWSSTLYGPQEQYSCFLYCFNNKICVGVDERDRGMSLFDSNNEDKYRPIGM